MRKTTFLLSTFILFALFSTAQSKNFIDLPYVEVEGYADTLVTPNRIYVKIIISEKDTKDKISVEEQERKMIQSLKNQGINVETDLTTSDILSNYKSYLLKEKDIIKTKEYILKLTTADAVAKVIRELEKLGISNTSIHKAEHSELQKFENICRSKAIIHSRENALALTTPISQTIGNAIHISENKTGFDASENQYKVSRIQIRGVSSFDNTPEEPKIEFEKIKISSAVRVKYLLK